MDDGWISREPWVRWAFPSGDELVVTLAGGDPDALDGACDFEVQRPDGSRWCGTAATPSHLDAILDRWRLTGEGASGTWLALPDLVVIGRPTIDCIRDAVSAMTADGALESVLQQLPDAGTT